MTTVQELARILRHLYDHAPDGNQNTAVLLFGIRYADDLQHGPSPNEIVRQSEIPDGWAATINEGHNLAPYVDLNDKVIALDWFQWGHE